MNSQNLFTTAASSSLNLWNLLLDALPAITLSLFLIAVSVALFRWFRKPISTAHHTAKIDATPVTGRKNFSDVYNRIHNYQNNQPNQPTQPRTPPSNAQPHGSTNSNYHHAIKLLQRGVDTKTLMEYCNLTQGEAERLQAVYGQNTVQTDK